MSSRVQGALVIVALLAIAIVAGTWVGSLCLYCAGPMPVMSAEQAVEVQCAEARRLSSIVALGEVFLDAAGRGDRQAARGLGRQALALHEQRYQGGLAGPDPSDPLLPPAYAEHASQLAAAADAVGWLPVSMGIEPWEDAEAAVTRLLPPARAAVEAIDLPACVTWELPSPR